jgi:hypothetical protein
MVVAELLFKPDPLLEHAAYPRGSLHMLPHPLCDCHVDYPPFALPSRPFASVAAPPLSLPSQSVFDPISYWGSSPCCKPISRHILSLY